MDQPLVSVVCLCYNHEGFVDEAVQSVLDQTYPSVEIIIVDDASHDGSAEKIRAIKARHPALQILLLDKNLGNCRAFNAGLAMAQGDFVIDLAADDVMMPDRIQKQIQFFETLPEEYGVVFTDAEYIDSAGRFLRNHFQYLLDKGLLHEIPQGDVYRNVLTQYFIASPTMMIRREVMDSLNGYDGQLAYEDFDFWVRSARRYKYAFLNEKLMRIRRTGNSMSSGWYKPGDRQLHSTYLVCRKAQQLSFSKEDTRALLIRVRYELRQSCFSGNFYEARLFFQLLTDITSPSISDKVIMSLVRLKFPLKNFRNAYHSFRFGKSTLP